MSVILEFTIDSEGFELGQVLSGKADDMHLEIERLVSTGNMIMPYVWATGDDHPTFQANVRSHPSVQNFLVLDTLADSGPYRIEWTDAPMDLIEGIAEFDAVVLEATGNSRWVFRRHCSIVSDGRLTLSTQRTRRVDSGVYGRIHPPHRP